MSSPSLLPYQQLLAQARVFADSYEKIKEQFFEFADHAAQLSKQGPVPDVAIEKDANRPSFDAVYLGRRFRFELKMHANNDGTGIGVVLCSEVLGKELKPVHQFTVNENGDTKVIPPDSQDSMCCGIRRQAWYLLLSAMHEGLGK